MPLRSGLKGNSPLGRHQLPISSVKARNATVGSAGTRSATSTRDGSAATAHPEPARWSRKAVSCSAQPCSVVSSQERSARMGADCSE